MSTHLQGRPFSFYPAIEGIEHNEWTLVNETWAELMVRNTRDGKEVGIPRRFVGEVTRIEEPVRIVGLKQALEYNTGQVWPLRNPVLSMPAPPGAFSETHRGAPLPTPPKGFRAIAGYSQGAEIKIWRLIYIGLCTVTVLALLVIVVVKLTPDARPVFTAKDQSYLSLARSDDGFAVVRKLGAPSEDLWKPDAVEIHYRRLTYKDRGYSVILMGQDKESTRYIGTMNAEWKPLHSVDTATGAMLRSLPRF